MPIKKTIKTGPKNPVKSIQKPTPKKLVFSIGDQPFIELNKLMKLEGLTETGGEAGMCIIQGEVKLNGVIATEKRKKIRIGDKIVFKNFILDVVE